MMSLHTILQLKDTPHGKQIAYQEVMGPSVAVSRARSCRVKCSRQSGGWNALLLPCEGTHGGEIGECLQPAAQLRVLACAAGWLG